jgi:hypothetical protein
MLKKYNAEKAGPSWTEVILGAILAVILGVAVGAVYMISKPVAKVTAIPKDAPAGAVYYIEGTTTFNRTGLDELRKSFLAGETVTLSEGDINAFLSSISKPSAPAPNPADKGAPPASSKMIDPGPLNARIHDGKLQLADTVALSAYGASTTVIVQATGTFVKDGSRFVFDPETIYVGGCPVQRLLFLKGWILGKTLLGQEIPADFAAAWSKLTDVSIEGSKLRLKAP